MPLRLSPLSPPSIARLRQGFHTSAILRDAIPQPNHYETLQIPTNASPSEVKKCVFPPLSSLLSTYLASNLSNPTQTPPNNPQILLRPLQNPPPRPQPHRPARLSTLRPNLKRIRNPLLPHQTLPLRLANPPILPPLLLLAPPPSLTPRLILFL